MRLRHKAIGPVIGGIAWEDDHVLSQHDLGSISGAVTVDLSVGSVQTATLAGNVTLTLPEVTAGTTEHLTLILSNDATAGRAVTIPGIQWVGGAAPEFDDAADARNILVLRGTAGGWIGDGGAVA